MAWTSVALLYLQLGFAVKNVCHFGGARGLTNIGSPSATDNACSIPVQRECERLARIGSSLLVVIEIVVRRASCRQRGN